MYCALNRWHFTRDSLATATAIATGAEASATLSKSSNAVCMALGNVVIHRRVLDYIH